MRRLVPVIILFSGLTSVASAPAADLGGPDSKVPPMLPTFNWSGIYSGFHLGGAWASDTVVQSTGVTAFSSTKVNSSGVVGGAQFGFNWLPIPGLLLGIETDVSGADLNGSATYVNRPLFDERVYAFGTARAQLGYVAGNWMFYGTSGLAWSDDTFTRTQISASAGTTPPLGDTRTNSAMRTGWTAGGGIEWGFMRNWTARVEYLHLDLSDETFSFNPPNNVFRSIDEGRLTIDTVRVGVNYLFN